MTSLDVEQEDINSVTSFYILNYVPVVNQHHGDEAEPGEKGLLSLLGLLNYGFWTHFGCR